jgi:hypothetical protein
MARVTRFIKRHRVLAAGAALAGIATAAFVVAYFEPQALLIDDEVDEALPMAAAPRQGETAAARAERPETVSESEFRGLDHDATGQALIVESGGRRYLRFEDLEVENGPDLKVYLSEAASTGEGDQFVDEGYVSLGDLKGNIGNQNYELGDDIDLARFRSAVIWCERFGVGFAVAPIA